MRVCSGRDGCLIRMRHALLSGGCRPWDGGQPSGRGADSDGSGDMAGPLGPDGNCFVVHRLRRPLYVGWAYRGAVAMPGTIVQLAYPLPCGQVMVLSMGPAATRQVRLCVTISTCASSPQLRIPAQCGISCLHYWSDCQSVGLVYQPSFASEIPHFLYVYYSRHISPCQVRIRAE